MKIQTRNAIAAASILFLSLFVATKAVAQARVPKQMNALATNKQLVKPGTPLINPGTTPLINPGTTPLINSGTQLLQPAVERKLIAANTNFGFKLFSEVLKQDKGKNIFVSPYSVAIALAAAYNGANGSTQQAMAKTLSLQGISLSQLNSANATLKAALENADPEVKLTVANSLWANKKYAFLQDFLQINQNYYKAKVSSLDFSNPNASAIINNWVKQNTSGKIAQIVENIDPDDALFLINAIYFSGNWTTEFDKNQTAKYPFYLSNNQQKQLLMMSQTDRYNYYENTKFQAVSLPYGNSKRFSFYVFLPKPNSSLTEFYKELNAKNWEQWMTKFDSREGFVRLPRFKIDYEIELKKSLTALGMGIAFTDQANFSDISTTPTRIDRVRHKTLLNVNEKGTEAAAATVVRLIPLSLVIDSRRPFRMVIDRPFFCAIRDNQTGTVLFMGAIVEP